MKLHLYLMASLALSIPCFPCSAAKPTGKAAASSSQKKYASWPKWYYYDQLGIRAWRQGDKKKGKLYLEKALSLGDAMVTSREQLNPVDKRRFKEMLRHQTFLISYYELPPGRSMKGLTAKENMIIQCETHIDQAEEKIRFCDRLINCSDKVFGRGNYDSQNLTRQKAAIRLNVVQKKAQVERLKGWITGSYDTDGKYSTTANKKFKSEAVQTKAPRNYSYTHPSLRNNKKNSKARTYRRTNLSETTQQYYRTKDQVKETNKMFVGGREVAKRTLPGDLEKEGIDSADKNKRRRPAASQWGHNPNQYNRDRSVSKWGAGPKQEGNLNKRVKGTPWGVQRKRKDKKLREWGNRQWKDPKDLHKVRQKRLGGGPPLDPDDDPYNN